MVMQQLQVQTLLKVHLHVYYNLMFKSCKNITRHYNLVSLFFFPRFEIISLNAQSLLHKLGGRCSVQTLNVIMHRSNTDIHEFSVLC